MLSDKTTILAQEDRKLIVDRKSFGADRSCLQQILPSPRKNVRVRANSDAVGGIVQIHVGRGGASSFLIQCRDVCEGPHGNEDEGNGSHKANHVVERQDKNRTEQMHHLG